MSTNGRIAKDVGPDTLGNSATLTVNGSTYNAHVVETVVQIILFYEVELETEFPGSQGIRTALLNQALTQSQRNSDKDVIFRAQ